MNPTAVAFGSENVGISASRTISISNSGGSAITVSNLILSGAGLNANGISTGLMLAPGQATTLTVSFDPAAGGAVAGSITVVSNASNSPTSISLSGTGISAPVASSVVLSWDPSTSSVIGYNVYSSTTSGGPYTKMTSSPLPGTTYTDTAVNSGHTYYFVATSVTSTSMESAYSTEISATVP